MYYLANMHHRPYQGDVVNQSMPKMLTQIPGPVSLSGITGVPVTAKKEHYPDQSLLCVALLSFQQEIY